MSQYKLSITEDEAIVLYEFFERFDESGKLEFRHPAEYVALARVSAQIDKTTAAMFRPDFALLLDAARDRIAAGFEGHVPGLNSGL